MEDFVKGKAGRFPQPQFCRTAHFVATNDEGKHGTAVALLGDSLHCFPPDLGQGVNSGFQDVVALTKAVDTKKGDFVEAVK